MSAALLLAAWFGRADLWPLLLVAPAVWVVLTPLERRRAQRRTLLLGPRVARLGLEGRTRRSGLARAAFAGALTLGLAACLKPSLGASAPAPEWRGMDVVVALDVSRSMLARDVTPDRLTRAQDEIRALASAAEGDRLGLVLFAGEARARVPLTRDRNAVAEVAAASEPTDVARGGTDLAAALEVAGAMITRGAEAQAAVVLLTDGEDHGGRGREAARALRSRGIAVHVLGVGSPRGSRITLPANEGAPEAYLKDRTGAEVLSKLDEAGLSALAGGGAFATLAPGATALAELHARHLRPRARAMEATDGQRRPEDRYQTLLAAALALLLLDLALRTRWRAALAVTLSRTTALRTSASARGQRAAAALVAVLLLGGCDATSEGRALAAEGRYAEALAAFEREAAAAGAEASYELRINIALTALKVGEIDKAAAAAKLADYGPLPAFVRGNVAFARSFQAEAEASRPGGDPAFFERALTLTEDALAAWRLAATTRADWPEARRNVERALLRLDGLREKRTTGADPRRRPVVLPGTPAGTKPPDGTPPPEPPAPPPPPEPDPGAPVEADPNATVVTTELASSEVVTLLETLRAKERQRQTLRRAQRERAAGTGAVEKDW